MKNYKKNMLIMSIVIASIFCFEAQAQQSEFRFDSIGFVLVNNAILRNPNLNLTINFFDDGGIMPDGSRRWFLTQGGWDVDPKLQPLAMFHSYVSVAMWNTQRLDLSKEFAFTFKYCNGCYNSPGIAFVLHNIHPNNCDSLIGMAGPMLEYGYDTTNPNNLATKGDIMPKVISPSFAIELDNWHHPKYDSAMFGYGPHYDQNRHISYLQNGNMVSTPSNSAFINNAVHGAGCLCVTILWQKTPTGTFKLTTYANDHLVKSQEFTGYRALGLSQMVNKDTLGLPPASIRIHWEGEGDDIVYNRGRYIPSVCGNIQIDGDTIQFPDTIRPSKVFCNENPFISLSQNYNNIQWTIKNINTGNYDTTAFRKDTIINGFPIPGADKKTLFPGSFADSTHYNPDSMIIRLIADSDTVYFNFKFSFLTADLENHFDTTLFQNTSNKKQFLMDINETKKVQLPSLRAGCSYSIFSNSSSFDIPPYIDTANNLIFHQPISYCKSIIITIKKECDGGCSEEYYFHVVKPDITHRIVNTCAGRRVQIQPCSGGDYNKSIWSLFEFLLYKDGEFISSESERMDYLVDASDFGTYTAKYVNLVTGDTVDIGTIATITSDTTSNPFLIEFLSMDNTQNVDKDGNIDCIYNVAYFVKKIDTTHYFVNLSTEKLFSSYRRDTTINGNEGYVYYVTYKMSCSSVDTNDHLVSISIKQKDNNFSNNYNLTCSKEILLRNCCSPCYIEITDTSYCSYPNENFNWEVTVTNKNPGTKIESLKIQNLDPPYDIIVSDGSTKKINFGRLAYQSSLRKKYSVCVTFDNGCSACKEFTFNAIYCGTKINYDNRFDICCKEIHNASAFYKIDSSIIPLLPTDFHIYF